MSYGVRLVPILAAMRHGSCQLAVLDDVDIRAKRHASLKLFC
jgi:hypothetical protein